MAKVKDVSSFHLQHAHEAQYSKPLTSLHSLTNLNLAYEYTLSFQQNHPGYDFMVLDTMALLDVSKSVGNVFTGYPPVGSVLTRAVNDLARVRSKPCKVITNMHSTFHVGSRNSDWGDVEAKEIINRNGDLVGSRNFTWSYLTPESKSMLRKHQSKLGMMKCSILKYSDRNHCFW